MDSKILASNILTLRNEKKWSQIDLAKFLNVSRQAVSKWETAQSVPDLDTLLMISKLFVITVNDLVEKNIKNGISDIEDIISIDREIIAKVLREIERNDIVKAGKGLSPTALEYISSLNNMSEIKIEVQNHQPVRLTEVENLQSVIVEKINQQLKAETE